MKQFSCTPFIVLILLCCGSPEPEIKPELKTVSIDLSQALTLSFDSVFKVEELISLQGSENLPIRSINRLFKKEEVYWILTNDLIILSDLEGNLIKLISNKGMGPGEYQSLDDIRWNEKDQLMEVLDRTEGKILSYSLSGEFEKEWKNRFLYTALSFSPYEGDYLVYGGTFFEGEGDRLVLVSTETGEKTNGFIPLGKERNFLNVINNDTFFQNHQSLEFFFSDNDTIYRIDADGAYPEVVFDPGQYKVTEEILQRDFENIMEFRQELSRGNQISLFTIQPTQKNYYLRFRQQNEFFPSVYNRSTGEIRIIKNWDSDFGPEFEKLGSFFIFAPIASDADFLYFPLDPYEVKSAVDELQDHPNLEDFLESNQYIKEIYENFENYENPYILKVSIREF